MKIRPTDITADGASNGSVLQLDDNGVAVWGEAPAGTGGSSGGGSGNTIAWVSKNDSIVMPSNVATNGGMIDGMTKTITLTKTTEVLVDFSVSIKRDNGYAHINLMLNGDRVGPDPAFTPMQWNTFPNGESETKTQVLTTGRSLTLPAGTHTISLNYSDAASVNTTTFAHRWLRITQPFVVTAGDTTGTADPFFPGVPAASTFAQQNFSTTTIEETPGLALVFNRTTDDAHGVVYKAMPSTTPFRVVIAVSRVGHLNQSRPGIIVRRSDTGAYVWTNYDAGENKVFVQNFNSAGAFVSGADIYTGAWSVKSATEWMAVRYDGTNLIFETSPDGVTFGTIVSMAKGSFDQIGLGIGGTASAILRCWDEDGLNREYKPSGDASSGGTANNVMATEDGPSGSISATPPHAFWRIYNIAEDGNENYISLSNVEFRTTVGEALQAAGGTPISSGSFNSGSYPASAAFDAADNTSWISNDNLPNYIGYHFPSPIHVAQVVLRNRHDGYNYQAPKTFKVQYSDDGAIWEDAWQESNVSWNSTLQTKTFDNPSPPPSPVEYYPTNLRALNDVDLSTPPEDGQALVWDATLGKWVPELIVGGGGSTTTNINVSGIESKIIATAFTFPSFTTSGSWTDLSWAAPTSDPLSVWNASQPTRITIPQGVTRMRVTVYLSYANSGSGGRFINLLKNGSTESSSIQSVQQPHKFESNPQLITKWFDVAAGDYFTIQQTTDGEAVAIRGSDYTGFGGKSYAQFEFTASVDVLDAKVYVESDSFAKYWKPPLTTDFALSHSSNDTGDLVLSRSNDDGLVARAGAFSGTGDRAHYGLRDIPSATKWRLTAHSPWGTLDRGVDYSGYGLALIETATGKALHLTFASKDSGGAGAALYGWNSLGSSFANYAVRVQNEGFRAPWLQVERNEGNLVFRYGSSPEAMLVINTQALTNFFTTAPDKIGLFAGGNNIGAQVEGQGLSFAVDVWDMQTGGTYTVPPKRSMVNPNSGSGLFDLSKGVPSMSTLSTIGTTGMYSFTENPGKALNVRYLGGAGGTAHLGGFLKSVSTNQPGHWAFMALSNMDSRNYHGLAFGFHDSVSGKLHVVSALGSSSQNGFSLQRWSDHTTRGTIFEPNRGVNIQAPTWIHLKSDGTNIYFGSSHDGANPVWFNLNNSNWPAVIPVSSYLGSFNNLFFGAFNQGSDEQIGANFTFLCVDFNADDRKMGAGPAKSASTDMVPSFTDEQVSVRQRAFGRVKNSAGTITMPMPTLPGNILVAMVSGYEQSTNKQIGPNFTWLVPSVAQRSNNGVGIATKISPGGETSFTFSTSNDVMNIAIYEMSNADRVRGYALAPDVVSGTFTATIGDRGGMKLVAIEHDGTDEFDPVVGASDFVNASIAMPSDNHRGSFFTLPYGFTGKISSHTNNELNTVLAYAVVEGRQLAALSGEANSSFLPHRYWRVVGRGFEDRYLYMSELVFAEKAGGVQLATGGTPFASGSYETNTVDKAFDGNPDTYWEGNSAVSSMWGGIYIGYDFGKPVKVNEVRVSAKAGLYQPAEMIRDGRVQFSDDGQTWFSAWDFSVNSWDGSTGTLTKAFANPNFTGTGKLSARIPARYWRVRVSRFNGGNSGWGACKMAFRDIDGAVISTNGTAISSTPFSNGSAGWSAARAFDGTSTTDYGWYSGSDSELGTRGSDGSWVGYDFARTVTPASFEFANLTTYGWSMPREVAIDYSFDGKSWFHHSNVGMTSPGTDNVVQSRAIGELPRAAIMIKDGGADYPELAGNSGKILAVKSDETDVEWIDAPAGGGGGSTAGYTQWRIYNVANNGGVLWGWGDAKFFDGDGNVVAPTSVTSSSNYGASYDAPKGVDGNLSSWFLSGTNDGATGAWFAATFEQAQGITLIEINRGTVDLAAYLPKDFLVQYFDGASWQTAKSITGQTGWGANEARQFTVGDPTIIIRQSQLESNAGKVLVVNANEDGIAYRATAGATFPTSPIAGDKFFRTDRGIEYFWNGTLWLSMQLHTMQLPSYADLTNATVGSPKAHFLMPPFKGQYTIYLASFFTQMWKNGNQDWSFTLRSVDNGTPIATHDYTGAALSTWARNKTDINATFDSSADYIVFNANTGNYGVYDATLTYRLIG